MGTVICVNDARMVPMGTMICVYDARLVPLGTVICVYDARMVYKSMCPAQTGAALWSS